MTANYVEDTYKVWATDNMIYGPVDLATLIQWVAEGRVQALTWIHSEHTNAWRQAGEMQPLLGYLLSPHGGTRFLERESTHGVSFDALRQFKVFAPFANEQLEKLFEFMDVCTAKPGQVIIQKGDPGDALFFILSGEVRARLVVGYEDTTLARIKTGEIFGEMSLFTQTARSADVVAECETRLLRLTAQGFHDLIGRSPELAAPILYAIAQFMAHRILENNARFQREVAADFVWR